MDKIKPYVNYAENLDGKTLNQFYEAMRADGVIRGALMPDAHLGYSMPIGGVIATEDMVYPSWVGYDIGCGMLAVPIDIKPELLCKHAESVYMAINEHVPCGMGKKNLVPRASEGQLQKLDVERLTDDARAIAEKKGWQHQLGTLGGGNHFIEVGEDNAGQAWIVIHSGSRGVGHGIAQHYMKLACGWDKPKEGNFGFKIDSMNGVAYLNDMEWAMDFALLNREVMLRDICYAIYEALHLAGVDLTIADVLSFVKWPRLINRTHNHVDFRNGMWIHRKGATHAEEGMMGVVPGNMRDGSFIVKGRGCSDALWSSSHGAGRVLGRRAAKRALDLTTFQSQMAGIVANVTNGTLDESPGAYKDIHAVMRLQGDMVEIVNHVKPIINVKG